MVEKLVHVPGDVFVGITAGQLDRAASMLEEVAAAIWKATAPGAEDEAAMLVEVTAFEWVADALRKVEEIVKEGAK